MGELRKAHFELTEKVMGPDVFSRKDHQSDQNEQYALQNGKNRPAIPRSRKTQPITMTAIRFSFWAMVNPYSNSIGCKRPTD